MCPVYQCDDAGGAGMREAEHIQAVRADDCALLLYLKALLHFQV